MWQLETSWWEMMLRAGVIYAGVFLLFRFLGKKQLGQLSPFDFVLVLIVSESVSNGLGANEVSITGALISASTLLALSQVIDFATTRNRRFERLVDGEAKIIIKDGVIDERVRRASSITNDELMGALRQYGVQDTAELKFAILETNGKISVIKK